MISKKLPIPSTTLWGTSVGGKETLNSWDHLPEDAYPTPMTATEEAEVHLHFERRIGRSEWGNISHSVDAIRKLEEVVGPYAAGRDIHVGDTIIGIKGRVGFEAAPLITIKA